LTFERKQYRTFLRKVGKNSDKTNTNVHDTNTASIGAPIAEAVQTIVKNGLSPLIQKQLVEAITKGVASVFAEQVRELNQTIRDQAKKINDLQRYTRRNSVRVYGIPEAPSGQKEDTDVLVRDVFKTQLKVEVSPSEICRSHRAGTTIKGKSGEVLLRPVIVKFTIYNARHRVYKEKKKLKCSPICIKEDLTPQNAKLLKLAQDKYGLRNTWIIDGRILYIDPTSKKVQRYVHE